MHRLTTPPNLNRQSGAILVLVAIAALCGFALPDRHLVAADPHAKPIQVVIDYGDGVEKRLKDLPLIPDMTVLDALKALREHTHGITYVVSGTGPNAMVTQIDDVKNEGGGPQAKNWMFRINGQDAERGAGVFTLSGGDTILWRFAVYEYNPGK